MLSSVRLPCLLGFLFWSLGGLEHEEEHGCLLVRPSVLPARDEHKTLHFVQCRALPPAGLDMIQHACQKVNDLFATLSAGHCFQEGWCLESSGGHVMGAWIQRATPLSRAALFVCGRGQASHTSKAADFIFTIHRMGALYELVGAGLPPAFIELVVLLSVWSIC